VDFLSDHGSIGDDGVLGDHDNPVYDVAVFALVLFDTPRVDQFDVVADAGVAVDDGVADLAVVQLSPMPMSGMASL